MYPFVTVLGRSIPTYGLMMVVGLTVAFLLLYLLADRFKIDRLDACLAGLFAMVGGLLGAKFLDVLINLPLLLQLLREDPCIFFVALLQGGMVFWGGFIGGFVMLVIYIKKYKIPAWPMFNLFTVPTVIGHGFGRIGCFLVGCCYGCPVAKGGVIFPHSPVAPSGIMLLPTQLIEAGFNFLLGLSLFLLSHLPRFRPYIAQLYLFFYPLFRFIIEFLRGDTYRGKWGPFWTSQWIAIFILGLNILLFRLQKGRKKVERSP